MVKSLGIQKDFSLGKGCNVCVSGMRRAKAICGGLLRCHKLQNFPRRQKAINVFLHLCCVTRHCCLPYTCCKSTLGESERRFNLTIGHFYHSLFHVRGGVGAVLMSCAQDVRLWEVLYGDGKWQLSGPLCLEPFCFISLIEWKNTSFLYVKNGFFCLLSTESF